jgi:hypothetical protein
MVERAGIREAGTELDGEEPLIVYVDIKRKLAFPLNLTSTPRLTSPRESQPVPGPTDGMREDPNSFSGSSGSSSNIPAMHGMHENPVPAAGTSTNRNCRSSTGAAATTTAAQLPMVTSSANGFRTSADGVSALKQTGCHSNMNSNPGAASLMPPTVLAFMMARRASSSAVHSMLGIMQDPSSTQGLTELKQRPRRASLPGQCAVTEGVRTGLKIEPS